MHIVTLRASARLLNVKILWKSEKIFRTDIRGMATVEMGLYSIHRGLTLGYREFKMLLVARARTELERLLKSILLSTYSQIIHRGS